MILSLFYEEPDEDRWVPYDRIARRVIRRLVRGRRRPSGHERVFLNLCMGLDRIGVQYRVNDYRYAQRHPDELICIIGKPFVLDKFDWKNPIVFGASGYSHPIDDVYLPSRRQVRKILVPGAWCRAMFQLHWGELIEVWPVGIDTDHWAPVPLSEKTVDILLYDKVRWRHDTFEGTLIGPIRETLRQAGRSLQEIRYGHYREEEFQAALRRCRAMVFLCEHETQGIAYQQALSCNVPIFAWDRGGWWQDPAYYPDHVQFGPVSSVPYWDDRCGQTFLNAEEFAAGWQAFWVKAVTDRFSPRELIMEELTLESCARNYLRIVEQCSAGDLLDTCGPSRMLVS
jgi:hypothetical protein